MTSRLVCLVVTTFALCVPGAALAQTQPAPAQPVTFDPTSQPAAAKKADPFSFADFTWLSGNPRTKESPMDTKFFTGEFRTDVAFTDSFNHPQDHTIGGSTEVFRSGELQLTQLGVGGDFHYDNVQMRLMTQFGMYSTTTPRNDASPSVGQWQLDNAYRYISEAYGGYHWDKWNGINAQAGIFMSYIGLWSYYNFDNWTYQPSYVSSNTPWFFNGMRVQIFPSEKLKIEPWLINGWQSYGKFNHAPGVGGQILWRPNGSVSLVFNNYYGTDTLGNPNRKRFHSDDSVQVKYYDQPQKAITKAALTFTFDGGCEFGTDPAPNPATGTTGVVCHGGTLDKPSQNFLGFMAYNRVWFAQDKMAFTIGGGKISNPGRYLVLIPPINGATAASGTPYFTANPGDPYSAWDMQTTVDYMPSQFITFRGEFCHRHASVPYFSGAGGITPPGGNQGAPGSLVPGWSPDLAPSENRVTFALLVKF
jgi:Putative beta-barrel porin-2, OmpL-like. bbp2